jgi:hypothetical protein
MRKYVLMFLLLNGFTSIYAQFASMPFRVGIFDINIIQYSHMIKIENKQSVQIDTHYNFTDANKTYELRYTLFRQTENNVQNIRDAFTVFSIMTIRNIAGYEIDLSKFTFFNDNDVKNDFNGDFGIVGAIVDSVSDYGNGYKYILLEIFYKNDTGIVVRTIMSNDTGFFLNYESVKYDEIYHSFKFKDK